MYSTFAPAQVGCPVKITLFCQTVKAGFPSPAETYTEKPLDLNDLAIVHKEATFFLRVSGESMMGAGIFHGDYIVVDRAVDARAGMIVVAEVGGEFTVKRLGTEFGLPVLYPDNPDFEPIRMAAGDELIITGVVTGVFRNLR